MRRIIASFLLFICLQVVNTYADNSSRDIKTVLRNLEETMSGTKTIQTDFIQEKNLALFNQPVILKGKIYIKKPDFFSWHAQSPTRYTMLIKGDVISQWDEESNQVQHFPLSGNTGFSMAIAQMKVWFFGAYTSLLKDYTAEVISENPIILEFSPLQSNPASELIKSVKLFFEKDERYLRKIKIEEKGGDSVMIEFSSVKLNMPINHSAWELKRDVK